MAPTPNDHRREQRKRRARVVGIVNATPDSFSDSGPRGTEAAIERGLAHLEHGAAVIEVGGESNVSNRPPVPAAEEAARVIPVIERLVDAGAVISIDTHKPEVARQALAAGAAIVNDISGLAGPAGEMIEVCAEGDAGVVLMHTETPPKTPRWEEDLYPDGMATHLRRFFEERLRALAAAGIPRERVILDPGPDFAKTPRQTVEALRALPTLHDLGCEVMLAVSRKDFIGALTGRPPRRREAGTYAALAAGLAAGADLLRVHDVTGTVEFLRVWEALVDGEEVPADLRIADA
ncbi:MAG TPA: dihydropteroate synthase, partial [Solirubrobacterales bacterium]|nr:dihydropteroate synthase [Solirubrobacterales bacterium]